MMRRLKDRGGGKCREYTKAGTLCTRNAFIDGLCKGHDQPEIHINKNLRGFVGGWQAMGRTIGERMEGHDERTIWT